MNSWGLGDDLAVGYKKKARVHDDSKFVHE